MINLLGVMTGTSCDGMDLACVRVSPTGQWTPLWHRTRPYSKQLRTRVLSVQNRGHTSSDELLNLHRELGKWYGQTIRSVTSRLSTADQPDVIANHGQTLLHSVEHKARPITFQGGDPEIIAMSTGITVLSAFRNGDLAAGGTGAPLLPNYHRFLARLSGLKGGVAFQNIGGIGNLTYLAPNDEVLSFDTGPGNMWIDQLTQIQTRGRLLFDRNGAIAKTGIANQNQISLLVQKIGFLRIAPPKAAGRNDFPLNLIVPRLNKKSGAKVNPSVIRTATEFTAETIAIACEKWIFKKNFPLHTLYLCGGGAKNPTLVHEIHKRLPKIRVASTADLGVDPQFVEAEGFAFLGLKSLLGLPTGGEWTGVPGWAPGARITPGRNWAKLVKRLPKFLGTKSRFFL